MDVFKRLPRNRRKESDCHVYHSPSCSLQLSIVFSTEPGVMSVFSKYWHLLNGEVGVLGFSSDTEQIGDIGRFINKGLACAVLEAEKSQDLQSQRPETPQSRWYKFQSRSEGRRRPRSQLRDRRERQFSVHQPFGLTWPWIGWGKPTTGEGNLLFSVHWSNVHLILKHPHGDTQNSVQPKYLGTPWPSQVDTKINHHREERIALELV